MASLEGGTSSPYEMVVRCVLTLKADLYLRCDSLLK
jgi:hypothetical protein